MLINKLDLCDDEEERALVVEDFQTENPDIAPEDTFYVSALQAEGLAAGSYSPSPIPSWPRLHWQTYKGPRTVWHENLRRARVDYRKDAVPNAEYAINHGIQLIFRFYKPAPKVMQRIADIICKVESNIDSLRQYERHPQLYANVNLHTGTAYAPASLANVGKRPK